MAPPCADLWTSCLDSAEREHRGGRLLSFENNGGSSLDGRTVYFLLTSLRNYGKICHGQFMGVFSWDCFMGNPWDFTGKFHWDGPGPQWRWRGAETLPALGHWLDYAPRWGLWLFCGNHLRRGCWEPGLEGKDALMMFEMGETRHFMGIS